MIDDLALLIHNLYVFMDLPLILIGGALSGNQDFSRLLEERVKTFLEASEVPITLRYVLVPIKQMLI